MEHRSLEIGGKEVELVPSFKFLGVPLSEDLKWSLKTAAVV